MTINVTYFCFGEIKQKSVSQLVFFGEKVLLDQRVTVPYAILSATDEGTGEIINDLIDQISGSSTAPDQCWHLRCLNIYPALLCLREIAVSFRGGNKPRHYHPAITFSERHGQAIYSADELSQQLSKTYRCGQALYPEILALIPAHQMADFIEAAWRTTKLTQAAASGFTSEEVEQLKLYHLLPPDEIQADLFC